MNKKMERIPILGVFVNPLNIPSTLAQFEDWIKAKTHAYVCVAPAHSIMECVNDPSLLPVFNEADMVTPDGMAIVWLLRLKGHSETRRVYGPDLLTAACNLGIENNWKHFFFGGAPTVAQKLAEKLQDQNPGLQVAGAFTPPFGRPSDAEEIAMIDLLNKSGADILWVGMSSPWQEVWMHEHLGLINIPVMVGVGAAFDYLSGVKPQAPHWIQRIGLEWFFRLLQEPKRMWPRYKQYPRFVFLALRELIMEKNSTRKNDFRN